MFTPSMLKKLQPKAELPRKEEEGKPVQPWKMPLASGRKKLMLLTPLLHDRPTEPDRPAQVKLVHLFSTALKLGGPVHTLPVVLLEPMGALTLANTAAATAGQVME